MRGNVNNTLHIRVINLMGATIEKDRHFVQENRDLVSLTLQQ